MMNSNASPWNPWKFSSITDGDRFTHRSSMSMAMNVVRNGLSSGLTRRA